MIVNVVCALIETFIEMSICIGISVKAYGCKSNANRFLRIVITSLLCFNFVIKAFNNIVSIYSISAILTDFLITVILLCVIIRKEILRIISWSLFSTVNIEFLKLPMLVIIGIIYDETLSEMNLINNSQNWSRVINCIIFILLFIVCIKYNKPIIKYLGMEHQRIVMLFVGCIEYLIIMYIVFIGWNGFTIHTFILTLCLIVMLFLLIVCLIVLLEYQMVIRINRLLKAKEHNMKINYSLISQEIERNRKINHDNKYDFEYLYHCLEQKDYEKGLDYIKQKKNCHNLIQKNLTWTGYGSIDFLINRAKARTDDEKISFTIKVDIVEIPIEEYDFFSVLSNLLDNAIEASMLNNSGRNISLQILSLNNVFRLKIENTYLIEPIKKGQRFISCKGDSKNHGWGIENVKEIINKYNGEFNISYGNGIFLVDLIIIQ